MSDNEKELRKILGQLFLAELSLPRHTPESGTSFDEHTYTIPAGSIWDHDKAMRAAGAVLGVTEAPRTACVGSHQYDEEAAAAFRRSMEEKLS
ncbi:MAG: hypothetical protein ACJKSS_00585 [Patescibacteria group bacterium UBA2103]